MATGFPVAQGEANYFNTAIPSIYAKKLQRKFYDGTCLAEISNTDYEGDIKDAGAEVIIRTRPSLVISDYEKGGGVAVQQPEPETLSLEINKGKAYAFPINPVDERQFDIDFINEWAEDASEQMKISIETGVFADIYDDAATSNYGSSSGAKSSSFDLGTTGTPVTLTKANVLDYLIDVGSVLSEQNVPETGRWAIIPVWMAGMIKKSDLQDASITGDGESTLRTGRIGRIDGLTIYRSNLLKTHTDGSDTPTSVLCGHKSALCFVTQLVRTERLKNPTDFGDIQRGLQVYGYKVIVPKGLVHLYAVKGAVG